MAATDGPWKFGVMGDTQWTCPTDPEGNNLDTVSNSIIQQINTQFINQGVKFVIQVGDLADTGEDVNEIARVTAAQPLVDAGIGFFPMRGNHETYGTNNNFSIPVMQHNYPQTLNGGFTRTIGKPFTVGTKFSTPSSISTDLQGMSYSFDFGPKAGNARFVILDPWATPSKNVSAAGYNFGYSFDDQAAWIQSTLGVGTRGTTHAFVFSHQPLIAENHQDCPFVGYTNANTTMQNTFYSTLQNNGVKMYIAGHDHIHQRSIVQSPDGLSKVQELICASDSSKFYTPKALDDPNWFGQKTRETSVSQDYARVGYYIYTVDGPRVTVDYYADERGLWLSDTSYPAGPSGAGDQVTPYFNFVKRETWGYSLNGKEQLVSQGGSYVLTDNTTLAVKNGEKGYTGTTAAILSGTNMSTKVDGSLINAATPGVYRKLTKAVDTGWAPMSVAGSKTASDIFTLWGMTDAGAGNADTYVLSLTYKSTTKSASVLGLSAKNASGKWVLATTLNTGGTSNFVSGPWNSSYGLGTYGVDPNTHTAWAVLNHTGDFVVSLK